MPAISKYAARSRKQMLAMSKKEKKEYNKVFKEYYIGNDIDTLTQQTLETHYKPYGFTPYDIAMEWRGMGGDYDDLFEEVDYFNGDKWIKINPLVEQLLKRGWTIEEGRWFASKKDVKEFVNKKEWKKSFRYKLDRKYGIDDYFGR